MLLNQLQAANLKFQKTYPGDKPDRQAVHTVYGGANLFKSDTTVKMGAIALRNLKTYAPDFVTLARVLELQGYQHLPHLQKDIEALTQKLEAMPELQRLTEPVWLSYSVYNEVIRKLQSEPIEDFRIDFEDGLGNRPDEKDANRVIKSIRNF